jgi:chromosomal replication initiation ATPase DnaA
VRLGIPRGEDGFGKQVLCDCRSRQRTPHGETVLAAVTRADLRIPLHYRDASLEMWPAGSPVMAAAHWCSHWPPRKPFLVLTGPVGTGKTTAACGVLRAVQERHGLAGAFWPVVELMDRMRATHNEDATETIGDIEAELRRAAVLVLDDLGVERGTDFASERLTKLIDECYRAYRPLVVTTNASPAELGARMSSRLREEKVTVVVPLVGRDRRVSA